ncbi:hypothetical protein ABZW03_25265 [Kitasatospora sp. NPDC004799]|uniref:hypothetical protein n=1 Tax=Kitasatospora sp. NPDC004799 TaxID=3154460 RepID=UPI0033A76E36
MEREREEEVIYRALDYRLTCGMCGHGVTGSRGQQIVAEGFGWFDEWQCENCGLVSDDYGDGPGPEDVRQGLLATFGGFRARLVEGRDGTVAAARHLREIFDCGPAEAIGRLKAAKAGQPLGTAVEVEALVRALRRDGYAYETVAAGSED